MCAQLFRNDIIKKQSVIDAFRKVERGFFVPESIQRNAYDDSPLRADGVHMSAPHIYGSIMDALDIKEGNSFLNVGSGTGYISSIAAVLGGATSLNHGIEVDSKVHKFALERTKHFRKHFQNKYGSNIAEIRLCCGNVFDLEEFSCQELPSASPVELHTQPPPVLATPYNIGWSNLISSSSSSSSSSTSAFSTTSSARLAMLDPLPKATRSVDFVEMMNDDDDDDVVDEEIDVRENMLQFGNGHLHNRSGHNPQQQVERVRSSSSISSSSSSSTTSQQRRSRSSSLASAYDLDVVYDRIYVGAACDEALKQKLLPCLSLGGILVAPVEDELVKILRIDDGLGDSSFVTTVLCGVRFVHLIPSTENNNKLIHLPKLPKTQWSPQTHAVFPQSFKRSCFAVLTAAQHHPGIVNCGINQLPNCLWLEVLSFTSRGWFENAPTEFEKLSLKFSIEVEKRKAAEQEAKEATLVRREAERECARWKVLARRLERQLRSSMEQQEMANEPSSENSSRRTMGFGNFFLNRFGSFGSSSSSSSSNMSPHVLVEDNDQDGNDGSYEDDDEDDDDDDDEGMYTSSQSQVYLFNNVELSDDDVAEEDGDNNDDDEHQQEVVLEEEEEGDDDQNNDQGA